jgi:hypothetical protein
MGIAIGAYLFNSSVRSGFNKIVVSLFTSLMNYMRSGKMGGKSPAKRSAPKQQTQQQNVGYKTNGAVKSLNTNMQCNTCHEGILIPADGQFKGFGVCSNCQTLQAIK